jgi:hypothetical protein
MRREDATEIQTLVLDACRAINTMEEIVLDLSKEERSAFSNRLGDAYAALQSGILKEIYDRFPDLCVGLEEPPKVSSFVKWDEVSLPIGISEDDLDAMIFSALKPNWQKTVMVIVKAREQSEMRGNPVDFEVLGARLRALSEAQRIERQGNLSMWRHSEVRLKQPNLA